MTNNLLRGGLEKGSRMKDLSKLTSQENDKISNDLLVEGYIPDILKTSDQWVSNILTRVLQAVKESKVPFVDK